MVYHEIHSEMILTALFLRVKNGSNLSVCQKGPSILGHLYNHQPYMALEVESA